MISGEEAGKDDFQKNQSIKPYKGESVPTLLSEIVGSSKLLVDYCIECFHGGHLGGITQYIYAVNSCKETVQSDLKKNNIKCIQVS